MLHLLQDTIQERTNGKSNTSEEEGLSELILFSLVWKLPSVFPGSLRVVYENTCFHSHIKMLLPFSYVVMSVQGVSH